MEWIDTLNILVQMLSHYGFVPPGHPEALPPLPFPLRIPLPYQQAPLPGPRAQQPGGQTLVVKFWLGARPQVLETHFSVLQSVRDTALAREWSVPAPPEASLPSPRKRGFRAWATRRE